MVAEVIHIPVLPEGPVPVFRQVRRGYDPAEVEEYCRGLEQELAELRWLRDDLAQEQGRLAAQRAAFEAERDNWRPSFAALGTRVEQLVEQLRGEVYTQKEKLQRDQAIQEGEARRRTAILEATLNERKRDAELEVIGVLARARAQAGELRAAAGREAEQLRNEARAEVAELQRAHAALVSELLDLRAHLTAMTDRLLPPG